ncbi:MAG: type 4a pilus biogenesis protein PilO [Candidatus Omnitrophota bacterium]
MVTDFISKLSEKEKKILYIALGFVVLAICDRLFLGPALSNLKVLDESILEQEGIIKSDSRFLAYKNKILKENEVLSPFYAQKSQTEEEIIASFLKQLEILATSAKINLAKVSPADSKQKKGYVEYYASLECDGRLEDVVKFMHAVDASDDLLKISKISMAPKRAGSEEISASMTVVKLILGTPATELEELKTIESGAETGSSGKKVSGKAGESGKGQQVKEGSGSEQKLSERIQMKKSVKALEREAKPEEVEPIKPSIFEKITGQADEAEEE